MGKAKQTQEVEIVRIEHHTINFAILGRSPLLMNAMSQKVQRELLLPKGRKNAAEKAGSLKHDPIQEFRNSSYKSTGDAAETRCLLRSTAFKGALSGVATDIPGVAKAQIARLTYVGGDYISIYGVPQLHMSVVRSADMNKTPDVRTRAVLPQWACLVSVTFTEPLIKSEDITRLLAASGTMRGVGDWRPEKGSGTFGQFDIVSDTDPRFIKVLEEGGRAAQDEAFANPKCYDGETEELLSWFQAEATKRGFKATR